MYIEVIVYQIREMDPIFPLDITGDLTCFYIRAESKIVI